MRIPDCAYCGLPLKGTLNLRVKFDDALGRPEIGWHGKAETHEATACLKADEEAYDLAVNCQAPENNFDPPPDDWIPAVILDILKRGRSRVSAGARLWRALR